MRELRRPSASRVRLPGLRSHPQQRPPGRDRGRPRRSGTARSRGDAPVSTRAEGAAVLVLVSAHATLSAGPAHLTLNVREGPTPGMWRYNLADGTVHSTATGRIAGVTGHMDVLRYAASICAAGYEPGTAERGLLEQFAADDMG